MQHMEQGISFSGKLLESFLSLLFVSLYRQGNSVLPGKNFISLSKKGRKSRVGMVRGERGLKFLTFEEAN